MGKCLFFLFLSLTTNGVLGQNKFNENWQEDIINIKTFDPKEDLNDLNDIGKLIGESKVVGLGETTHGTHEIFEMKHRVIKYLIEEKGFNIVAFESNKPETDLINKYIQGAEGNPKQLLEGIYFWTWQTQELLNLINWLRDYNVENNNSVQFLGIDMQYNNQALKNLELLFYNDLAVMKVLEDIRAIYKVSKKSKINFEKLEFTLNKLKTKIQESNKKIGRSENEIQTINENISIVEQVAYMDKTQSSFYRDECMGNYVKDYQERSEKNKIIVWAHNMHIAKNEFWTMGHFLKKQYGENYYSISFALSEGTFTAKDYQNKIRTDHELSENPKNSIEYKFDQVENSLFFIETKSLKKDKWFYKKRKFRDIGAALWGSEFLKVNILNSCDGIIFIKKSSSSRILK